MGTNNIGSEGDCVFMRIHSVFMHTQIDLYSKEQSFCVYFILNLMYLPIYLIRDFFAPAMLGWLENKNCSGIDAPCPDV